MSSFASSYIPTTTAAVTRAADALSYPVIGNFDNTVGSIYLETMFDHTPPDSVDCALLDSSNSNRQIIHQISPTILQGYDGTTVNNWTTTTPLNTSIKWVMSYGKYINVVRSGSIVPPLYKPFAGSWGITAFNIGAKENLAQPYANIRNVKIYKKALTDAQLMRLTQ